MSHYIGTKQQPHWGPGRLSGRQLSEIVVGAVVVVALMVAAYAYISTADPIADSGQTAGSAPLTLVTHSALDPFETQYASPQVQAAVGTASAPLTLVTHSALDPFETQYASPPGGASVGATSEPVNEGSPNPMPEFR